MTVCKYQFVHQSIHQNIHPYVHQYIHSYIHRCITNAFTNSFTNAFTNTCTDTFPDTFTDTFTNPFNKCMHRYMHRYIHPYIHSYIHPHIHTIHSPIQSLVRSAYLLMRRDTVPSLEFVFFIILVTFDSTMRLLSCSNRAHRKTRSGHLDRSANVSETYYKNKNNTQKRCTTNDPQSDPTPIFQPFDRNWPVQQHSSTHMHNTAPTWIDLTTSNSFNATMLSPCCNWPSRATMPVRKILST